MDSREAQGVPWRSDGSIPVRRTETTEKTFSVCISREDFERVKQIEQQIAVLRRLAKHNDHHRLGFVNEEGRSLRGNADDITGDDADSKIAAWERLNVLLKETLDRGIAGRLEELVREARELGVDLEWAQEEEGVSLANGETFRLGDDPVEVE